MSLNHQLAHHTTTILKLVDLIGKGSFFSVRKHLKKCIYTVAMGNNDFINNYFHPQYYKTSTLYTPEEYTDILVQQYSEQLLVGTSVFPRSLPEYILSINLMCLYYTH